MRQCKHDFLKENKKKEKESKTYGWFNGLHELESKYGTDSCCVCLGQSPSSWPFRERLLFGYPNAHKALGGSTCAAASESGPLALLRSCARVTRRYGARGGHSGGVGDLGAVLVPLCEERRPQLKHKAGTGRVDSQYLAQSGLPQWDSRAVSFRTFLCHLY